MQNTRATLTDGPVGRTLIRLTVPMLFGHLGMILFNLADTYFVGQLGTDQLAALSFTFPVVMVLSNLALGMGVGATSIISRTIGEGDYGLVRRYATDSLLLSLALVAVLAVAGLLTIDPLFRMLGAGPATLPYIHEYMDIWYMGMMFVVVPMVGNSIIRGAGDTVTPSAVMLVAVAVNIVLDPLLIFGIGPFPRLGIGGAALATLVSRFTTFVVSLAVLHFRYRMLALGRVSFARLMASWRRILHIALPAGGARIIMPLGVGMLTGLAATFGPHVVAAYGVAMRFEFFALSVIVSLSVVVGPFVGQNWGAGLRDRARRGIDQAYWFAVLYGLAMWALLAVIAPHVAPLFNDDPDVTAAIVTYLRIVPAAYGMLGSMFLMASVLNVLDRPFTAAMLSLVQVFVFTVPLAWAGARAGGTSLMFAGIAAGGILSGIAATVVTRRRAKERT